LKFIRSSLLLIFLSCHRLASNNLSTDHFKYYTKYDNYTIGFVGCSIINPDLPTTITNEEIEIHIEQNLIDNFTTKSNIHIIDRTKLKELLDEYALTLSGLIQTKGDEKELDIQSSNYLLMGKITGFSLNIRSLSGDEDMSESSYMFQSKLLYYLNLELLDAKTGYVEWAYSKEITNADYRTVIESINFREQVFQSLSTSVENAVGSFFIKCGSTRH